MFILPCPWPCPQGLSDGASVIRGTCTECDLDHAREQNRGDRIEPARKPRRHAENALSAAPLLRDPHHIGAFEPVLSCEHQSAEQADLQASQRGTTMTSFRFSGLKAITICAALSLTAGLAFAGDGNVSAAQILNALQPKPMTRGLSTGPQAAQADPAVTAKEASFLQGVRNRQPRSLSLSEREQIAEIATTKPNIDLEINFDFNSASISTGSMPSVKALGDALSDPKLKG